MKPCTLRRKGPNSAAIKSVEATMASCDSWPVSARNVPCSNTTPPRYVAASVAVSVA